MYIRRCIFYYKDDSFLSDKWVILFTIAQQICLKMHLNQVACTLHANRKTRMLVYKQVS